MKIMDDRILLFSLACMSIMILVALSQEFEAHDGLSGDPGDRVSARCFVIDANVAEGGSILELIDLSDRTARAYVPGDQNISIDDYVWISGTYSDDGGIIFVEELRPL